MGCTIFILLCSNFFISDARNIQIENSDKPRNAHFRRSRRYHHKGLLDSTNTNLLLEAPSVAILTFSNGQAYCDENALMNALNQNRPENVAKVVLMIYETSNEPSAKWLNWTKQYKSSSFEIEYRWFDRAISPSLGALRNLAKSAVNASFFVNMDNDDVEPLPYFPHSDHPLLPRKNEILTFCACI